MLRLFWGEKKNKQKNIYALLTIVNLWFLSVVAGLIMTNNSKDRSLMWSSFYQ